MKNRPHFLSAVGWICSVFLAAAIALIAFLVQQESRGEAVFSEKYVMAEELPALLSFTYYDREQWEKIVDEIASGRLSYRELDAVLEALSAEKYVTYEKKGSFTKVSRKEFFQIYGQLLDILDVDGRVSKGDLVFIQEKALEPEQPGGQGKENCWLTQKGWQQIEGGGQYLHPYDMYRVYLMDGSVIGLKEPLDTAVTWKNIFIHSTEKGSARILFEKELLNIEIPELSEQIRDTVCDLEWKASKVSAIYKKEDIVSGKVLSYDEDQIEITGYGTLKHDGDLKIYKTYGTVEQLDKSKLVIGNLLADFVVARGEVCGIILKEPAKIDKIRVLLLNGESPYYSEVFVSSGGEMTATFKEKQKRVPADTGIKASWFWKKQQEGYLRIDGAEGEKLFLVDEDQNPISLGYQGSFEIRRLEKGYVIVNELSLEDYLCGVVPSEMPATYETEALRAQAVCARSYACMQLSNGTYAKFGANVDDSTNYQVYNKQAGEERTILAVRDTVGEVLRYKGALAEAYYYSTSCGLSQEGDVWELDSGKYGYLKSVSLLVDGKTPDLSEEKTFEDFIRNRDDTAYDSQGAYFRWRAELDTASGKNAMNEAILQRQAVNHDYAQVFDKKGASSRLSPIKLGAVTGIAREERSVGGVLKSLRITYEKGTILVNGEYNIRKILGAAVTTMTDKNDQEITALNLLPSAAFAVIPTEKGYVLYGGGYGHGIGLSQNGANGMAKAGLTYTDILHKFYQNITIDNIYNSPESQ